MNKYLSDTIFRAFGSSKRVKIFKIKRRRIPGMVVCFETLEKSFHATCPRVRVEEELEKLNGFREPRLDYRWSSEDLVTDLELDQASG